MKTITGQWSNAADGTVRLELSKYALIAGTADNAPRFYQIPLDGNGAIPANYQIWANDELMPEGSSYKRTVFNAAGTIVLGPDQIFICGTAPISLIPAVPPPGPTPPPPPPPVTVVISPGSATLAPGSTQQFTSNTAVTWSSSDGQISSSGLYTAPSVTAATTVTITATSVTDSTNSTSITISIQPVAQISVTVAPGGGIASGVGCTGATADANCLGWNGMMNGAAWNRDPGESDPPIDPLVYYSLVPSSLYHAGNARQASDGTDMGADMNKIRQAFQSTIYTGCSNVSTDINYCGPTGPFPD